MSEPSPQVQGRPRIPKAHLSVSIPASDGRGASGTRPGVQGSTRGEPLEVVGRVPGGIDGDARELVVLALCCDCLVHDLPQARVRLVERL